MGGGGGGGGGGDRIWVICWAILPGMNVHWLYQCSEMGGSLLCFFGHHTRNKRCTAMHVLRNGVSLG